MLVAIAEVGNGTVVVRRDLIQCLQAQGYRVCRIGQVTRSDEIHPDYERLQVEYVGVPLERTNVHPLRELKGIAEKARCKKERSTGGDNIRGSNVSLHGDRGQAGRCETSLMRCKWDGKTIPYERSKGFLREIRLLISSVERS